MPRKRYTNYLRKYVGVRIGTNNYVKPNATIGNNVIKGSSPVVTHDILNNTIFAGTPAIIVEIIEEYASREPKKFLHCKDIDVFDKEEFLLNYFF